MAHKRLVPLIASILLASGCASSTIGPGAGATRGIVKGDVGDVAQRAESVLKEMNVQVTGSSTLNSGNERQLIGRLGDTDVRITMDNASNSTTNVTVTTIKNLVSGNRDLSREILAKIVEQS